MILEGLVPVVTCPAPGVIRVIAAPVAAFRGTDAPAVLRTPAGATHSKRVAQLTDCRIRREEETGGN